MSLNDYLENPHYNKLYQWAWSDKIGRNMPVMRFDDGSWTPLFPDANAHYQNQLNRHSTRSPYNTNISHHLRSHPNTRNFMESCTDTFNSPHECFNRTMRRYGNQ